MKQRFSCFSCVLLVAVLSANTACVGVPEDITVVQNFQLERYLGRWYEIARLDHSFERGLSRVTADYSLRDDGGIRVINRGFNAQEQQWAEAEGRGYFVDKPDKGQLKVSFFGPFYGAYNIIDLDKEDYAWSLVAGPNRDYLWILSRKPVLPAGIQSRLIETAAALGFATDELIFVQHE